MGTSKLGISSSAAVTAAAFMLASSASAAQNNDYHDFVRSLPSPAEFIGDQDIEYSSETMEWIEDVGNDVKVIESGSEDYERFCEIRASVCNSVALFLTPVPIYSLGPSPDDVANGEDIHFIVTPRNSDSSMSLFWKAFEDRPFTTSLFNKDVLFTISFFHELQHYKDRVEYGNAKGNQSKFEREISADRLTYNVLTREFGLETAELLTAMRALKAPTDALHDSSSQLGSSDTISIDYDAHSKVRYRVNSLGEACTYGRRNDVSFSSLHSYTQLKLCFEDMSFATDDEMKEEKEVVRQRYIDAYNTLYPDEGTSFTPTG